MWDKFINYPASCLPCLILFRPPTALSFVAHFVSICGHRLFSFSPVGEVNHFACSKTLSSGGIFLLHNSYNWGIFSIWQSLIFTPIFPGYASIVGHPRITSHFPYMALHSSTIKESIPYYEKIRFNSGTHTIDFSL